MVKTKKIPLAELLTAAVCLTYTHAAYANAEALISEEVTADACDERHQGDDTKTAENRAVDKAGLSAIKLSGIIQKHYPDLSVSALDTIAYRIIDEYMTNSKHEVTLADEQRICVNLSADVSLTKEQLAELVREYRDSEAPEEQIAAVAEQVNRDTAFKPQKLADKKLLYIKSMSFWNGEETDHYKDLLTGLFSHSEYFYVTQDAKIADYTVKPRLLKAEVDEIDTANHKMQMSIELDIFSDTLDDFIPLTVRQMHFILFAADKEEQEIADTLLRKLLTNAAGEASAKIDKFEAARLEKIHLHGK